jgi:hypothetical protein
MSREYLTTLRAGERVQIRGDRGGRAIAIVRGVAAPAQLPALEGAPLPETLCAIVAEREVDQVTLITYDDSLKGPAWFFALHPRGATYWRDLEGQRFRISET